MAIIQKQKKDVSRLREVPIMNPAVWYDGVEWLRSHGEVAQMYLEQTRAAVEQGFTADEIYYQVIREAGLHRAEIAERCRAAANWFLNNPEQA